MSTTRQLPQDAPSCKRRRIAAGLTQAQLAARAGISNAAVHRIENGEVAASVKSLAGLARALDCEIADLMPALEKTSR
jgi:transcriptional regulator with XRE-family HTH domain